MSGDFVILLAVAAEIRSVARLAGCRCGDENACYGNDDFSCCHNKMFCLFFKIRKNISIFVRSL